MDCKIGDGTGGSEIELEGLHTTQECITAVKELYPQANGATMPNPCPDECSCYAEFDMKKWNNSKSWQSCIFKEGNHQIYRCSFALIPLVT